MRIRGEELGLFLRGKSLPGLIIREISWSTSECAILLVVAGRGSDTAALLFWGTGYSIQDWRSGAAWHRVDVRMCRRSTEAEGNRNGSSRASPVQTSDIFSRLFQAGGRPCVFGLSRMVALSDSYASQISTGLQIVTNVYINVNVLT